MSDLSAAYQRLSRPWTHEQLAAHYREANRRGEGLSGADEDPQTCRPVAVLATAVPACASLSVAVHVIHVLPATRDNHRLVGELLGTAENSAAVALHRCDRALALDGRAHDYIGRRVAGDRLRHRCAAPRRGASEPRAAVARRPRPRGG